MINKYSFKKYSKGFPKLFAIEKNRLIKIIPNAKIEHIGSSSVKGLGGKGIIDIALSVPKKEIQNTIKKLQRNGYDYKHSGGDKERRFFQKIVKYSGNERRVHIQLTYTNSKMWRSMIAIREYLKNYREVAKEYARIKKGAVKYARGEGRRYRKYKKKFLDSLERKALKGVRSV